LIESAIKTLVRRLGPSVLANFMQVSHCYQRCNYSNQAKTAYGLVVVEITIWAD